MSRGGKKGSSWSLQSVLGCLDARMYVFLSARWGAARQQTISHPTTVVFLCRTFSRASERGGVLFERTPLERSQSTPFVFSHGTFNAGRVLTCTERSTPPPPCPLLWPCPPSVLKLTEVKSSNRCGGGGALHRGDPCDWSAPGRAGVASAAVQPYMSRKRWAQQRRQRPWQPWAESLIWKQWADNTASPWTSSHATWVCSASAGDFIVIGTLIPLQMIALRAFCSAPAHWAQYQVIQ